MCCVGRCRPQRLPGRFDGAGELIFALKPYLQLEWTRQAKESTPLLPESVALAHG
jgi:hypothetical protein